MMKAFLVISQHCHEMFAFHAHPVVCRGEFIVEKEI